MFTSSPKKPRILVVDDLPDNVFLLQVYLEAEGYEVSTTLGGYQALREINESSPDLVLLDLMMPDLDGWEVVQRIRHNPAHQDLPILLVTAHGDMVDASRELSLRAQVNGCILKPFDFEQLLAQVQRFLPPTRELTTSNANHRFEGH